MAETDELGAQLREHALLEGDFLLRSGKRSTYYLDKYRFPERRRKSPSSSACSRSCAPSSSVSPIYNAARASASRRSASGALGSSVTIEPSS